MPKRLITTIIIVLLSSYVCSEDVLLPFHPRQEKGYEVKDEKVYFRAGNAGMTVEIANEASIEQYFRERGTPLGNPFPGLHPQLQTAMIFQVTIINRTNGSISFTPRYSTLRLGYDAFFPLDFTLMLPMLDDVKPQEKLVLLNSVFHSTETIPQDTARTKFLIFPAVSSKKKEMTLEFDYLYFEDREIRAKFYYERKKN